ncbi:STT3 domain-containing protein [Hydrogenivirga sp. 128-5-R1-1]|uniref:STT3 domain-containing protein n=1 Tax=Hydrogenivirga sp. 128-5-R1-1 TaxID=392423 RepID=UPI00015F374D|nr:STT3 domain-containing protein [Hydrogenivirga sp. 128-5-R1-1]EDP74595.1 putative integral membrane protein (possible oligosaccharyl transferase) [Hydrogenivirga sp. 128-5-R1-1]
MRAILFLSFLIFLTALYRISTSDLSRIGENYLTCFDCYYYAELAIDNYEGKNKGVYINYKRNVPDFTIENSEQLIVLLPGWLSSISGLNIHFFIALLPPVLSLLFIIPLHAWINSFMDKTSALYVSVGAYMVGVFNLIYWTRTKFGRYDTDFLILFFLFMTLGLVWLSLNSKGIYRTIAYTVLAGLFFKVFMWWYPKPFFVFLFIWMYIVFLFFKENKRLIGVQLSIFSIIAGLEAFIQGFKSAYGLIMSRVFEKTASFVPLNMATYVSELNDVDITKLSYMTNEYVIMAGTIGLILMFRKYRYAVIAILPIIAMGFLVFFAGNRMLIYLGPFLGIGFGYTVYKIHEFLSERFSLLNKTIIKSLFILITISAGFSPSIALVSNKPTISGEFYKAGLWLQENTEQDAYIWSWWDYGHIIRYLSDRSVYIDNANWHYVKTFAVAKSFVSYDENLSRKIVSYVTNQRGLHFKYRNKTYKEFLEDVISYQNLKLNNPVYVVLVNRDLSLPILIGLGSFYLDSFSKFNLSPINECVYSAKNNSVGCMNVVFIDSENYTLRNDSWFKGFLFVNRDKGMIKPVKEIDTTHIKPDDLILFLIKYKDKYYEIVVSYNIINTFMFQAFIIGRDFKYFDRVYDAFPYIVIYKAVSGYE